MAEKCEKVLEPWSHLDGKVVLVTGASSGLGREFCLDLAKTGCYIVAAARRKDRLKSLCDEINRFISGSDYSSSEDSKAGKVIRAVAVELDVNAEEAAIDASIQKAWDAFGRIDALVNNAGVRGRISSSFDFPEKEWGNVVGTNLTGAWVVAKCVGRRLRDTKHKGSVINITSVDGLYRGHLPGGCPYASSKAGLNALTQVMAVEMGPYKIRVNAIAPGIFKSEITEKLMEKEWINNVMKKTVPLGTFGTSDPALTSLVRYLIHDSSEYVSGNVFIVDAGATLPGVPIFSSL
uniref:3-oxoacyl-[acyl-carrier-protein] reductase FabG-like n=2 Tax=Nelumbo nucifera TaxID=4432 RepID=A0A822YG81_NELNU|nr:TPA_asm: hypothetical protein HUJ06_031453 [Nelumbo nucifera]